MQLYRHRITFWGPIALASIGICCESAIAADPKLETLYKHSSKKTPNSPYSDPLVYSDGSLILSSYAGGKHGAGQIFQLVPPGDGQTKWTYKDLYDFKGSTDGIYPLGKLTRNAAGVIFGTTIGAQEIAGTIFRLTPPVGGGAWTEDTVYNFSAGPDLYPSGGVVIDKDEDLLGVAGACGSGEGCIYEFSFGQQGGTDTFSTVYSFTGGDDGGYPDGGLIIDSNDAIYGAAYQGGASNNGVVFSLTPKGQKESVIYDISNTALGYRPASVVRAPDGSLYGVATYGGANGGGAVFHLTPPTKKNGSWVPSTLVSLDETTGEAPLGELAIDMGGNLYGTATRNGSYSYGTVFEVSPPTGGGSWTVMAVHSFRDKSDGGDYYDGSGGAFYGFGGMTIDSGGNLFGTTSLATDPSSTVYSGTVFKLSP